MAVSIVDANATQGHTSSGTSLSLTSNNWYTGSPVGNGNLLVASVTITSNNHALSSFATPSGWSLASSVSIANYTYVYILYKLVSTSNDMGGFTTTFTSATSQVCSYGISVWEFSGTSSGSDIQFFSQTTSSTTMTITATPTKSGAGGFCGYSDSTLPSTLNFTGTGPIYDNTAGPSGSANDDIENVDTSGGKACYATSTGITSFNSGSGTSICNASATRTHPISYLVIVQPSGSMTYTNSPSDTIATFSSSTAQIQSVQNNPTQTDSFSSSNVQNVNRVNTTSDTASTLSAVLSQNTSASNSILQTDSFASSVLPNQNVHNSKSDAFNSIQSLNQILSAGSSKSDTFSMSNSETSNIAKLTTVNDSFSNSSSVNQNISAHSTESDSMSFASTVLQNQNAQNNPVQVSSFSDSISQRASVNTALVAIGNFVDFASQIQNVHSLTSQSDSFSDTTSSLQVKQAMLSDTLVSFVANASQTLSAGGWLSDRVISLVDSVASLAEFRTSLSASQSFADSVFSSNAKQANVVDTFNFSATPSLFAMYKNTFSNVFIFNDVLEANGLFKSSVMDSWTLSDIVHSIQNVFSQVNDAFSHTDILNSTVHQLTSCNEAFSFSDIHSALYHALQSVADTFSHGDSVAVLAKANTTIANAQSFIDSVKQQVSQASSLSQVDSFNANAEDEVSYQILLEQVSAFEDFISYVEQIIAPLTILLKSYVPKSISIPYTLGNVVIPSAMQKAVTISMKIPTSAIMQSVTPKSIILQSPLTKVS